MRELVSLYKQHQKELYKRYVFPIGDEPDGTSWSGFQWLTPGSDEGYLLIFRERENTESQITIQLRNVAGGQTVEWVDLRTNRKENMSAGKGGITLEIDQPADFLFMKYRLKNNES